MSALSTRFRDVPNFLQGGDGVKSPASYPGLLWKSVPKLFLGFPQCIAPKGEKLTAPVVEFGESLKPRAAVTVLWANNAS